MTPDVGATLTNIGTCLPNQYVVGNERRCDGSARRLLRHRRPALPDTLAETDLTTLDSDTLARNGVVSYVPAYPLWSDTAGKMRYVRTPHNQPIVFDKRTQTFQIPPNTRFYKTFLKKIVDIDGDEAYRKIETRLIVARPDTTAADGTVQQTALFGTYIWNDTETAATLQQDPLRDGQPFTDASSPTTSTSRARRPSGEHAANLNLDYALDTASAAGPAPLRRPGQRALRPVPHGERQRVVRARVHAAPDRHPPGRAERRHRAATGDELTQLQRLIDYNVITGISSPADVLPLEKSQLPRTPAQRLRAARAGVHARELLPLPQPARLPDDEGAGAQGPARLPARRTAAASSSSRSIGRARCARRGVSQDIPIPYITPSLRDIPEPNSSIYKSKYARLPRLGDDAETDGWCTKPTSSSSYRRLRRRPLAKPHLPQHRYAVRLRRRSDDLPAHAA